MAFNFRRPATHPARGISLPTVLMFMVIITMGAAYGIRRATLNEGITRNQLDYEVARQAAEAALRDAERDMFLVSPTKPATAKCDRTPARPMKDKLTSNLWATTCPKGQCYVNPATIVASNYVTKANPQVWWPTSKDGKWGDNEVVPASCSFFGGVPLGTFTATPALAGVSRQPEYLIEWIDRADDAVMRVTARGFGADINTEVVLQTYVRPAFN